jgi:hypothetical protein
MPPIGNINSSGNLVLPTGLLDPIVKQPTNPVPSKNSDGFSDSITQLGKLFPNAPKFEMGKTTADYINKSLGIESIPKAYLERYKGKNPAYVDYLTSDTYKLTQDLKIGKVSIPKGSTIFSTQDLTNKKGFVGEFVNYLKIETPQKTAIELEPDYDAVTGEIGYKIWVITKDKAASAFSPGAFGVTKDGKIQSLRIKQEVPTSSNSHNNSATYQFAWKAQDPQDAAGAEKQNWQDALNLIK